MTLSQATLAQRVQHYRATARAHMDARRYDSAFLYLCAARTLSRRITTPLSRESDARAMLDAFHHQSATIQ